MALEIDSQVEVSARLVEAIRQFPLEREVEHCGSKFPASSLALYATCPRCGHQIKLRAFTGGCEIEDVFDAVLEWMSQPGARERVQQRQAAIEADRDD